MTLFFSLADMSYGAACIFLRGGKNIVSAAPTPFPSFDGFVHMWPKRSCKLNLTKRKLNSIRGDTARERLHGFWHCMPLVILYRK